MNEAELDRRVAEALAADQHRRDSERKAEKERRRAICAMGKEYNCASEALDAINDGTSAEDFRAGVVIARLEQKNRALTAIVGKGRDSYDPVLDEYNSAVAAGDSVRKGIALRAMRIAAEPLKPKHDE